ncbi:TetR/AcrR family transcriptional regulator [Rhodococcus sp. NPDC056960]|uniref:TetR/AcrR family transcriptional regulator n=1 Tax=Rhodococcus sp. NPDC056960 TaxID=3345982 RepID=UPI0036441B00
MTGPKTTVRRRPKDRKDQILEAARTLIVAQGYRNVSMAQIADEVGITASALYRHFSNKAVLLDAVIGASFDEVTPTFDPDKSLASTLAETCELVVTRRDVGALWWREGRNLPEDMWEELRERLRRINGRFADLIRIERPALSAAAAEQLAWGVQSILASTSTHSSKIARPEFAALLTGACVALCATDLGPPREQAARRPSPLAPVSKREALLGHAIRLFSERGYDATGLDDIGTAAGVTGPNLYSYFAGKADLLEAAIERGTSALWLLLHSVLRANDDPARALADLTHGYVQLALDRTILTSLLQTEQATLSDVTRARQREYVAEWTALLRSARPELDEVPARILVHTALGVVNTVARIEHLQADAALPDDLAAMATAVLFAD